MSRNGVPSTGNALQRLAELADKAAGYPSEAVFWRTGEPSGVFTLRAAEPIETEEGAYYPITEELERVIQRGAPLLTAQERAEFQQAVANARPIPQRPETSNDRITPRNR